MLRLSRVSLVFFLEDKIHYDVSFDQIICAKKKKKLKEKFKRKTLLPFIKQKGWFSERNPKDSNFDLVFQHLTISTLIFLENFIYTDTQKSYYT